MGQRLHREPPTLEGADVAQGAPIVDFLAGTSYRAVRQLGAGGMAVVFEARHVALDHPVVVKLIHPALLQDEDAGRTIEKRLLVEARALCKLRSPHIVQVTDFGVTKGGATFIVMERLYGRTLGDELHERGALPVGEALAWGRQVLEALDVAHRAGIVHRDVKPDNVFLCDATETTPRQAKLLDFGVAHMANAGVSANQLTLEGQMVGTPRSAAPEQIVGKKADARSDIYGVGVLLYTMVAGRGPFAGAKSALDVLRAHLHETPVPPSRHGSQAIAPELDEAILMALAKNPAARFQTPAAFRHALDGIAESSTTAPAAPAAKSAESTQPLPIVAVDASRPEHRDRTEVMAVQPPGLAPSVVPTVAPSIRQERRFSTFVAVMTASCLLALGLLWVVGRWMGRGG
jgi:serine/threonine-protein kinase